jgi:aryl-alcohol dehydrogenase-like predicted oxidoreductase
MTLPTRVLGKTGLALPILGFGTAPAGKRLAHREAVNLFETALNAGVTYFDTAPEFSGAVGPFAEKAAPRDLFSHEML